MDSVKKIVLTGPESSGKSALGRQLARHFKAVYIAEYARLYLEQHGPRYDAALLRQMAREHQKFQAARYPTSGLVFLDTDLINYKIWFEMVFNHWPEDLERRLAAENDHHYLLLKPDLPWQPDPLRENEHQREALFIRHRQALEQYRRPYRTVEGQGQHRLKNALAALQAWLP